MKTLLGVGGSGMLLGGLYAGDALTPGQIYDVPLAQAHSELSTMQVPNAITQAATAIDAPTVAVRRSDHAINWQFQVRGQNVAAFTARLTPEGPDRTRVRVEYTPGEPLSPELRHLSSATLVRELARLAMSEQVDAQLERRPFDQDAVADALGRHAAAHPEQIRELDQALGETVVGLYRQANETSREVAPVAIGRGQEPVPSPFNQSAVEAAARPDTAATTNQ